MRVAGEEGGALAESLGQQQAVERIFMQRRQAVDVHRVLAGDGNLGVAASATSQTIRPEPITPEKVLRALKQKRTGGRSVSKSTLGVPKAVSPL